jgi:hypothetical protein
MIFIVVQEPWRVNSGLKAVAKTPWLTSLKRAITPLAYFGVVRWLLT